MEGFHGERLTISMEATTIRRRERLKTWVYDMGVQVSEASIQSDIGSLLIVSLLHVSYVFTHHSSTFATRQSTSQALQIAFVLFKLMHSRIKVNNKHQRFDYCSLPAFKNTSPSSSDQSSICNKCLRSLVLPIWRSSPSRNSQ